MKSFANLATATCLALAWGAAASADNDPTPGSARPWGAQMTVSTYSSVNLRDGNVLTAIPIIDWSGLGPDMQMVLYHNSANVSSALPVTRGMGFNLGDGWTCTFSGHLIYDDQEDTVLVIHDDGTQDLYTWDSQSGVWDPPTGVHGDLVQHNTMDGWTLTFKNQSYRRYDDDGLLEAVGDACGEEITVARTTGNVVRIDYVTDAAGRLLDFQYSAATNKLVSFYDPKELDEPDGSTLDNRQWNLAYDGSGRLNVITDPENFTITIDHNGADRMHWIEDKDGDRFTYDYTNGRLSNVLDPDPPGEPTPLDQDFAYTFNQNGTSATVYTDRRGLAWDYDFDATARLVKSRNPLDDEREYVWNSDNNLTDFYNELDKRWQYTYDANANVLKVISPLTSSESPKMQLTYDSLNNVTSVTDGEGNVVTYEYEREDCPTLVTTITLPSAGQGTGEIALSYYTDQEQNGEKNGLLADVYFNNVYSHNILLSRFDYDQWGQLSLIAEGEPETDEGEYVHSLPVFDSGSRIVSNDGSTVSHDANNNATGAPGCPVVNGAFTPITPEGFPTLPGSGCEKADPAGPDTGWSATYTGMSQVLELTTVGTDRVRTNEYDELGRLTSRNITTDEYRSVVEDVVREFTFDHDWANGEETVTGPDGEATITDYDDAGRPLVVVRESVSAEYDYYDDGRVSRIDYANGTHVEFTYDNDGRVLTKKHYDDAPALFLQLAYTYDDRDLPLSITESNAAGAIATVTFSYDNRGRLITEERIAAQGVTTPEYDLAYDYDQLGNRIAKSDLLNDLITEYTYDIEAPDVYESDNNRLMKYTVTIESEQELLSTTYYYYDEKGNPLRIVTEEEEEASPWDYTATRFVYDPAHRVAFVMGEVWSEAESCEDMDYFVVYVREFRYEYDDPRERYMEADRDCDNPSSLLETRWSDYLGGSIYADFLVTDGGGGTPAYENKIAFLPGIAVVDPHGGNATVPKYYHTDHLGTTRSMSNSDGDDEPGTAGGIVYTAFGEPINDSTQRYGYIGAWGYRAHADMACNEESTAYAFPYLHVGFRYYDPASGRFLQRDPIGANGGLNVYVYIDDSPADSVDPLGLQRATRLPPRTGCPVCDSYNASCAIFGGPSRDRCQVCRPTAPKHCPICWEPFNGNNHLHPNDPPPPPPPKKPRRKTMAPRPPF